MLETVVMAAALTVLPASINLEAPDSGPVATEVKEASTVPTRLRNWAQCVLRRETGGVLGAKRSRENAINATSSAQGRWQMLDASGWREGGAWLVFKRLREQGFSKDEAHRVREYLAQRPIRKWSGFFQDMAFIQSVNEGGWRAWYNGGDHCDRLAPR